jgi:CDP-diacylglycerol--serine O-phosphatidyltransferase
MNTIHKLPNSAASPRRSRRLKRIAALPALLTLGNLIFGFAAIHFAARPEPVITGDSAAILQRVLPSNLAIAAYMLLAGMLCDAFDGRVARLTRQTSDFGGQLDSLADIVSFGIAPAFMITCLIGATLEGRAISPISDAFWGRLTWTMAAIYVACAALRLARYNVETMGQNATHVTTGFKGFPTPGAAAVIVGLILVHEEVLRRAGEKAVVSKLADPVAYAMPFIALGLGLLMVSRLPYVHMGNTFFRGRKPFFQIVLMVIFFILAWIQPIFVFAACMCIYAISTPAQHLWLRVFRSAQPAGSKKPIPEKNHADHEKTA